MSTPGSTKASQRKGRLNKADVSVTRASNIRAAGNRAVSRNCGFMLCKRYEFTPLRLVKRLGGKVAKGLRLVSKRMIPSPKVSSSGRSKPFVTPVDSHRTEAIEDCIEFINSSSSLPRSNSRSANPR